MPDLLDLTWLIPVIPLLCSFFIGILLISFNRTMNRLTKPTSFLMIIAIGISTILSFLGYQKHINGIPYSDKSVFANLDLGLYVDDISLLSSMIISIIMLLIITSSYFLLDRRKGYIRYIASLGFLSSVFILFVFSGDLFHDAFRFLSFV
tara:strand:+ start:281 stop:730 length:450 start_codon:yes stop_codon:yes gene_type:complete